MRYLLLIYEAEEIWENKSEDERREVLALHGTLHDALGARNVEFQGAPLMPTATAVSVRQRNGDVQVSDGPFAETKEQLAGFYLVDVATLEDAIEAAKGIPNSETGTIEVRPLADHSQYME